MSEPAAHVLDARGLMCPLPVIRTQQRVKELAPGDVLDVVATDRGVLHDIPAWCRVHGHEVVRTFSVERDFHVVVRINDARTRATRS